MLKNNAQIARESIQTTLELPGPFSGPWTPAESEFGSALVCVLAHNLLRPPPPLNENPGFAPADLGPMPQIDSLEHREYKKNLHHEEALFYKLSWCMQYTKSYIS